MKAYSASIVAIAAVLMLVASGPPRAGLADEVIIRVIAPDTQPDESALPTEMPAQPQPASDRPDAAAERTGNRPAAQTAASAAPAGRVEPAPKGQVPKIRLSARSQISAQRIAICRFAPGVRLTAEQGQQIADLLAKRAEGNAVRRQIEELLTPEQRQACAQARKRQAVIAAMTLVNRTYGPFERLGLTDAQAAQAIQLVDAARTAMVALDGDDEDARQGLAGKLQSNLMALLTDEQKQQLPGLQGSVQE